MAPASHPPSPVHASFISLVLLLFLLYLLLTIVLQQTSVYQTCSPLHLTKFSYLNTQHLSTESFAKVSMRIYTTSHTRKSNSNLENEFQLTVAQPRLTHSMPIQ